VVLVSTDGTGEARPFLPEERDVRRIRFSPDGRWAAYISSRSGRPQAYLRAYPDGEADWRVSASGASSIFWSRDGGELFFQDLRKRLMRVTVQTEPSVLLTEPELVLDGDAIGATGCCAEDSYHILFQPAPDGERFVFVEKGEEEKRANELHVVLNWLDELETLLP
jgi:hypothetical protein